MSKQLPPNPGLGDRYFEPIRVSLETMAWTSPISQSAVFSVKAVMEFMLEILWASMAFDINLPSSADAAFVLIILPWPWSNSSFNCSKQTFPLGVFGVPITVRSGLSRFEIAYPSARNSGIEATVNNSDISFPGKYFYKISIVILEVPSGTVDLLTNIL